MKNWAFAFMILGLVACGADQTPNYVTPSLDDLGKDLKNGYDYVEVRVADGADVVVDQGGEAQDHLGAKANESRQHLSDRNASAEDANKNYVSKKDRAGAKANEIRKDLSDSGVSSEQLADKYTEAQDHVGKQANDAREYAYTRGPEEVRWGDQSTQDQAAGSAGRLDAAEARLTLIEQINESQSSLIKILFSLSSSETAARKQAMQDEARARRQAVDAETAARTQADADQSASFAQSLADTTAVISGITSDLQVRLDDLSSEVTDQGLAIDDAEARLNSVDAQLQSLRDRADLIEQVNVVQNTNLFNLRNDLTDLEGDLANEVTARAVAVAAERLARQGSDVALGQFIWARSQYAASQLQLARAALQGQIDTLVTDLADTAVRVDALDVRLSAAESDILDASAVTVVLQTALSNAVAVLVAADASLSGTVGTLTATVAGHTATLVAQDGRITTLESRQSCSINSTPMTVVVTNMGFDGSCGGPNKKCREGDFNQVVSIDIPQVTCTM